MKSEPYSISVRSRSLTPRASKASVKTPVPGPSSRTGPQAGVISLVIRLARSAPDGAIAPTLKGLWANARKNSKTFCVAMRVSYPSSQRHHRLLSGSMRYEGRTLWEHCATHARGKKRPRSNALPTAIRVCGSGPGRPERHLDAGAAGTGFANRDHAIVPPHDFL